MYRDDLFAVEAWLHRVLTTRSLAPVPEPEAVAEARRLTETLAAADDGDLQGCGVPKVRRATNASASQVGRSIQCASSTMSSMGAGCAASTSRSRVARAMRKRSGAALSVSPKAASSAAR